MKKSQLTDTQVLNILKQNESGASVPDLCREHGMSNVTFFESGLQQDRCMWDKRIVFVRWSCNICYCI